MTDALMTRCKATNHRVAALANGAMCPHCTRTRPRKVKRTWVAEEGCFRLTGVSCGHVWLDHDGPGPGRPAWP